MNFGSTWPFWVVLLPLTLLLLRRKRVIESRRLTARMGQLDRMSAHPSPALGLAPMMMSDPIADIIDNGLVFVAFISVVGLVASLLVRFQIISF